MAISVLIADREILFADALASALGAEADFDVADERPNHGVAAVHAAVDHRPDVVLLDYWLGDTGGPALARQLRERLPGVRVVHLTWFHHPDHVEVSRQAGAVGLVPKSLRLAEIGEVVRRAHRGAQPLVGRGPGESAARAADRGARVVHLPSGFAELSPRELEVLRHLAAGRSVVGVAERLGITPATARTHADRILIKTDTRSQLEAVAKARSEGVVQ